MSFRSFLHDLTAPPAERPASLYRDHIERIDRLSKAERGDVLYYLSGYNPKDTQRALNYVRDMKR